ncbi:MAG: HEAT repeat domain-containing protein [Acidobacteria bacterium]|nr:HEAT repeat domain-containing protein [Acidobacteriota bacterium]
MRLTLKLQWALAVAILFACVPLIVPAQQQQQDRSISSSQLTPQQLEIAKQQLRLNSSATEERRDAVMRLGWMKRPESSRVAATALRDSSAIVRATATRAVLWLGQAEAAALLLPLLQDRDEFVRQETAYALGETHSRTAVSSLIRVLGKEKKDGVRGAAVVALGQIGDEMAVIPLAELLGRRVAASGIINRVRRSKRDENEFVRRAAARSLGQIRSRAAVPALSAIVIDERAPDDVRREAANSLGLIGDPAAIPALRAVLSARDPYLSRIASEALLKIAPIAVLPPTTRIANLH